MKTHIYVVHPMELFSGRVKMTDTPGAYVLLMELVQPAWIQVGRLGRRRFDAGWYAYVGSAMGGIERRIARHQRPLDAKRVHWHIDRLLGRARLSAIYIKPSRKRQECLLAARLGRRLRTIQGFGASDCRCSGHLFYASARSAIETLLEEAGLVRHV